MNFSRTTIAINDGGEARKQECDDSEVWHTWSGFQQFLSGRFVWICHQMVLCRITVAAGEHGRRVFHLPLATQGFVAMWAYPPSATRRFNHQAIVSSDRRS
tara:strand:- start:941 stop:1243 length:303 start_codon:yes stop_codon:yes gene_type:complete